MISIINTVIFDMDGLMFNTELLTAQIWDTLGTELGYGKISSIMAETMGVRVGSLKSKRIFFSHFGDGFPYDDFIKEYRLRTQKTIETNGLPVKPGLYTLLDYLKKENYKMAVASSTSRKSVLHYCGLAKITAYFTKIICGDMVEKSKPDPQIYLTAAREVGADPKNCMVLEDSPNGILSAYRAGMSAVMVPDLVEPDEKIKSLLCARVRTLEDVIPLLEKIQSVKECDQR